MFYIQVASDLHLDYNDEIATIKKTKTICQCLLTVPNYRNTVLLLAGDICKLHQWPWVLEAVIPYWDEIWIVLGNHEFYEQWIEEGYSTFRTLVESYPTVKFLEQDRFDYKGYTVLGATGWAPAFSNPKLAALISDFIWIKDFRKDANTCQRLHHETIEWIKKQLSTATKPVILITHFGMIGLSSTKFPHNPLNSYFLTGALDDSILKPTLMLHGHTHESYTVSTNCYSLVCNPYGYGNENYRYLPNQVLTLYDNGLITL